MRTRKNNVCRMKKFGYTWYRRQNSLLFCRACKRRVRKACLFRFIGVVKIEKVVTAIVNFELEQSGSSLSRDERKTKQVNK